MSLLGVGMILTAGFDEGLTTIDRLALTTTGLGNMVAGIIASGSYKK